MSSLNSINTLFKIEKLHNKLIVFGLSIAGFIIASIILISINDYFSLIGVCLLILICAWSVGAALGLLVSMPSAAKKYDNSSSTNNINNNRFVENNKSYEKITDALVIFIAGIATTQVAKAREYIIDFQNFLIAHPIKCYQCSSIKQFNNFSVELVLVGPFLLILGLTFGFICGFLFTQIRLVKYINDREKQIETGKENLDTFSADKIDKTLNEIDEKQIKNINVKNNWKVDKSINSSLDVMEELLYQPNAVDKVLEISGQLSITSAVNLPRYWVLTACAYGQKLNKYSKTDKSSNDYQSARDNALDCIKRAVRIEPKTASWILSLSNPSNVDNDLKALYDDPDFHRIVSLGY